MVELIKYVVEQIVDDKQAVQVVEAPQDDGTITVTIKVAESEVGKIIGKQGKVAMSLRTLAKAVGIKQGKRYNIEIED